MGCEIKLDGFGAMVGLWITGVQRAEKRIAEFTEKERGHRGGGERGLSSPDEDNYGDSGLDETESRMTARESAGTQPDSPPEFPARWQRGGQLYSDYIRRTAVQYSKEGEDVRTRESHGSS